MLKMSPKCEVRQVMMNYDSSPGMLRWEGDISVGSGAGA